YFLAAQESCDDEERKLLQNHLENIRCEEDEEDKNQPPLAELMLEFERIRCHWLWYPCRRENEIEDLDRLVAFDDVRACLIRLPTELTPHLVALFLLFLRCPQLELDQDCCSLLHRLQTAVGDQQLLASIRIHFGANSATSGRGELGGFYRAEPAPNWRDLQLFRLRPQQRNVCSIGCSGGCLNRSAVAKASSQIPAAKSTGLERLGRVRCR
uniref:F-box domain-containing protein n=1 Tax=Macrostomum lignano TaxID=282301 RepID=A0A1I8H6Z3_9PLAT